MQFIKMASRRDGCGLSPAKPGTAVRYVRADLFDEIIISVDNGEEKGEKIYTVEGVIYNAKEYESYVIKFCDTFEEAEEVLENIRKWLRIQFVANDVLPF